MESQQEKSLTLKDLQPKMRLEGTVKKIELFGAFVDVGVETDGMVHISMLQQGHVNRVEDVVQVGATVEVWIRKVDTEKGRLELSMIKPILLPWKNIKPGMKVNGKVVRLESFGAFVDIGAERPGLVHVSELSNEYVKEPSEVVKVNDEVEVTVLDLDRKKHQIRLSLKQSEGYIEEALNDVEEEIVPTAMEFALRQALDSADPEDEAPIQKDMETPAPQSKASELEDILSRTLKQRVKS